EDNWFRYGQPSDGIIYLYIPQIYSNPFDFHNRDFSASYNIVLKLYFNIPVPIPDRMFWILDDSGKIEHEIICHDDRFVLRKAFPDRADAGIFNKNQQLPSFSIFQVFSDYARFE